jgi:nitronate monooxygenase
MEMQLRQSQEVISFFNSMLAAERAGVEVLSGLLKEVEDKDMKIVLERFLRDEGMNCQIFSTLIRNTGEDPGKTTGDFVQKVKRLDNIRDKLNLLVKGQEWVARQIRKNRPLLAYGAEAVFMESIKIQHEENVDFLKQLLGPA